MKYIYLWKDFLKIRKNFEYKISTCEQSWAFDEQRENRNKQWAFIGPDGIYLPVTCPSSRNLHLDLDLESDCRYG